MKAYLVNSFTIGGRGGNGAGVVLCDSFPGDEKMQRAARAVGLSETVFICPAEDGFASRFFTPQCEVDLCGHATIAAFFLLGEIGLIKGYNETITVMQDTRAGKLPVDIIFQGGRAAKVLMEQSPPENLGMISGDKLNELCGILGIGAELVGLKEPRDFLPEIISTGLPDIIFPVLNKKALYHIRPDFEKLAEFSLKAGATGVHVFTLETDYASSTVQCRNFGPAVGIDEESATGTANGALAHFLCLKGLLPGGEMKSEQGFSMGKPSMIFVKVDKGTIKAGGAAVTMEERDIIL